MYGDQTCGSSADHDQVNQVELFETRSSLLVYHLCMMLLYDVLCKTRQYGPGCELR